MGLGAGGLGFGIGGAVVWNEAVTAVFAEMTNTHGFCIPLQAPLQPANVDPASACAFRVRVDPSAGA